MGATAKEKMYHEISKLLINSTYGRLHLENSELITEQYDCVEPRKEQRAIWRYLEKTGDGHLRDADTKYYSMSPPVVMKFLNPEEQS